MCSHSSVGPFRTHRSVSLTATTAGRSHAAVATVAASSPAASSTAVLGTVVWLHTFPNRQLPRQFSTRNSDGSPVVQSHAQGDGRQVGQVSGSHGKGLALPAENTCPLNFLIFVPSLS
jgi:hypothetical protein